MSKKTRRSNFTPEMKEEAVKMYLSGVDTLSVCRRLDIASSKGEYRTDYVTRWVREATDPASSSKPRAVTHSSTCSAADALRAKIKSLQDALLVLESEGLA